MQAQPVSDRSELVCHAAEAENQEKEQIKDAAYDADSCCNLGLFAGILAGLLSLVVTTGGVE